VADHTGPVISEKDMGVRYTLGWDFAICTADNSMEIEGVDSGGPSFQAGLRVGDVVVAIDDIELSEVPFSQLKDKLHQLEESPEPVRLRVRRGEAAESLVVVPTRE
jgi:C-terminal processing protease CtpA/Prc